MTEGSYIYEYALIRYIPSVERGEFINVGLVMMCKRLKRVRVKTHIDRRRLEAFRCPHSIEEIERQLEAFSLICDADASGRQLSSLPAEERFRWLTAVRSACIRTSRPHPGVTLDFDNTFNRLFTDLVL